MYDVIIKSGTLFSGLDNEGERLDLGIVGNKIVAIAPELRGGQTIIDAKDRVVCPGFIDMHSHSGLVVFEQPQLIPKIHQGITSEVIGVDGISVAPVTSLGLLDRKRYVSALDGQIGKEWSWQTFPQYIDCLRDADPSTNLVPLIPHGAVRDVVMGWEKRPATKAELDSMCSLVLEALEQGAGGLSFGLIYAPGAYASREELVTLSAIAARYDRLVVVHVRNESEHVVQAVKEMADISVETGARMHISHLKIVGVENQHLLPALLQLFIEYAEQGFPLSFDQYPYNAGSTQLATLLPLWVHEGGAEKLIGRLRSREIRKEIARDVRNGLPGWENLAHFCGWGNIVISFVASQRNKESVGKSIEALSNEKGLEPLELVFDLLLEENLRVGMIDFYGNEEVKTGIMSSPFHTVGTDGIFGDSFIHPRLYGTFPRILGHYVRQLHTLSLRTAINSMTYKAAQRLRLSKRGALLPGYFADVVVFDPRSVKDTATYARPTSLPLGIDWVLVNGKIAVGDGASRSGQVLLY